MAPDWYALCADEAFDVSGDRIYVDLGDGRSHTVKVTQTSETWELMAVVATQRVLHHIDSPSMLSWARNRLIDLVGFRVDRRGRLVANAWVPKAGSTAEEFTLQGLVLAREADRCEFSLSGADSH